MRLRYSRRAISDLRSIADYVRERSPAGSRVLREHLRRMIGQLADYPQLGMPTAKATLRRLVISRYPYVVFYQVTDDTIIVHHIRHVARKPIDPADLP